MVGFFSRLASAVAVLFVGELLYDNFVDYMFGARGNGMDSVGLRRSEKSTGAQGRISVSSDAPAASECRAYPVSF